MKDRILEIAKTAIELTPADMKTIAKGAGMSETTVSNIAISNPNVTAETFLKVVTSCGFDVTIKGKGQSWSFYGKKQITEPEIKGNLCWSCKNAYGGCCWSREFRPVPGWEAKPTVLLRNSENQYESYNIKSCPLYERG